MITRYPFIYICSLMRTGSTLVQELLSLLPMSYIFHEPKFGQAQFQNEHMSIKMLENAGIPIDEITKNKPSISVFLHSLNEYIKQLGAKEIRNTGWEIYLNLFDDIRVIFTGRDPRDIYLSCHYYLEKSDAWTPRFQPFCALNLYKELESEIKAQYDIASEIKEHYKLKYEDINNHKIKQVKDFVQSPLMGFGEIGDVHSKMKRGKIEIEKHGNEITDKSKYRWKNENNQELLSEANKFYNLMKDHGYNDFWGY